MQSNMAPISDFISHVICNYIGIGTIGQGSTGNEIISPSQRPFTFEHPHFHNLSIIENRLKIGILVFYESYPHRNGHLHLSIHFFHKNIPDHKTCSKPVYIYFYPISPYYPISCSLNPILPSFPHPFPGGWSLFSSGVGVVAPSGVLWGER